jgi:hypothetical protein
MQNPGACLIYSNFKKLIKTISGFSCKWKNNNGGEPFGVLSWSIGLLEIRAKSDKGILSILIAVAPLKSSGMPRKNRGASTSKNRFHNLK